MSQPLSDIASIVTICSGSTVIGTIALAVWNRAKIGEYLARVAQANGRPRAEDIESATRRIEHIGGDPERVAHEAGRALGSVGMNHQAENMYEMESYVRRRSQSPSPARSSNGEGSSGQRPGSRQSHHSTSRQSQVSGTTAVSSSKFTAISYFIAGSSEQVWRHQSLQLKEVLEKQSGRRL
jgi:hypothetical protein